MPYVLPVKAIERVMALLDSYRACLGLDNMDEIKITHKKLINYLKELSEGIRNNKVKMLSRRIRFGNNKTLADLLDEDVQLLKNNFAHLKNTTDKIVESESYYKKRYDKFIEKQSLLSPPVKGLLKSIDVFLDSYKKLTDKGNFGKLLSHSKGIFPHKLRENADAVTENLHKAVSDARQLNMEELKEKVREGVFNTYYGHQQISKYVNSASSAFASLRGDVAIIVKNITDEKEKSDLEKLMDDLNLKLVKVDDSSRELFRVGEVLLRQWKPLGDEERNKWKAQEEHRKALQEFDFVLGGEKFKKYIHGSPSVEQLNIVCISPDEWKLENDEEGNPVIVVS